MKPSIKLNQAAVKVHEGFPIPSFFCSTGSIGANSCVVRMTLSEARLNIKGEPECRERVDIAMAVVDAYYLGKLIVKHTRKHAKEIIKLNKVKP